VLAATKLVVFAVFVIGGILTIDTSRLVAGALPGYGAFSASVLLLFYAFVGFETATIPGAEMREPQRDLAFALMVDVAFVTLLYALVQIVCIGTVPALESSARPLADASARFLGGTGAALVAAGAIVTIGGNLNAQLLGTPRILFAMAEQQQVPSALSRIHTRFRTPHVALFVTAGAQLILAVSGGFAYLATLSVITRILGYSTACAALPLLRRRDVPPARVRIPLGGAVSLVALLACVWLLSSSTIREARDTAAAVAVGCLLWALGRRPGHRRL
jgi:amino acid transporter